MTTLETKDYSPPELWVKIMRIDDFPIYVKTGNESVVLEDEDEARLFGLGLHFGDIMRCKQEGVEV
jgi:hypothetical protein